MTSEKQAVANRRNAERSTGPKTPEGKAIARMNALKHGGLSPLPVIPHLEQPAEWEAHLTGMIASLRPVGHLETVLAERVALVTWRMSRLARYEREVVAISQERVVEDLKERRVGRLSKIQGPPHPDDVRGSLRYVRDQLRMLERFPGLPDARHLSGEQAMLILDAVADRTEGVNTETFSMPEVVPDRVAREEYRGWTAGLVRRGIAAMAAQEEADAAGLVEEAREHLRLDAIKLEQEAERVATELDQMRRQRLLPEVGTLERISRYEAHLSRQLAQALHELQRLQAARAGDVVPPPAALDLTVSAAD